MSQNIEAISEWIFRSIQKWKMFIGDSGAYVIGHLIAWCLVFMSQDEGSVFPPVVALWVVLIPLIDALSTFFIRLKSKKPIFSGDRNHIHHIFLDNGLSESNALIVIVIFSFLGSLVAYLSLKFSVIPESYLFYGFLTVWVFYLLLIKYPLSDK